MFLPEPIRFGFDSPFSFSIARQIVADVPMIRALILARRPA
jgi:hypothetical protein